jgi:hypothetical protein
MKDNQGTMVLSGVLEDVVYGEFITNVKTILEYSNVLDITKAWRVKDFKVWLKSTPEEIGIANWGNMAIRCQLNTDDLGRESWWNAGDNRAIAFMEVSYGLNSYNDKQSFGQPTPPNFRNSDYYMQPDHIIQNRLDIAASVMFPESSGMPVELNYIIYLEEVNISPIESIVFNIKSKAQDLSS